MLLLVALPGIATLLIEVLIFLLVIGVIYWLVTTLAPEPIRKYAVAIVVVIAVILLIYFLMQIAGGGSGNLLGNGR